MGKELRAVSEMVKRSREGDLHNTTTQMKFFNAIAASTVIASAALVAPADAAPTTCALRTESNLEEFACDHSIRVNANGHKVNDIAFFDGRQRYDVSIIYWTENGAHEYAEVFINGQRTAMESYTAKNGSWCVSNNATQLCLH